jgi:flagellar biosynthesis protein FliR
MFVIALQMTAPLLASSFLVTLVFSLLGRAVPQMKRLQRELSRAQHCGLGGLWSHLQIFSRNTSSIISIAFRKIFIRVAQMLAT